VSTEISEEVTVFLGKREDEKGYKIRKRTGR
jgi:hypothetical protein